MGELHSLVYRFRFDDGVEKVFTVNLDPETLQLRIDDPMTPPEWTRLESFACSHCPLDKATVTHCPIAANLGELVEFFKDMVSHTEVDLTIQTPERNYQKRTSVQGGVSSLIGIYMVTSGCPVMEKLKPMVRFHLPFATLEETKYRAITMYLMAQYLRRKQGLPSDDTLKGLADIYEDIRVVNLNFCDKLQGLKVKDTSLNAISILDSFADFTQMSIDYEMQDELVTLFHSYLEDGSAAGQA